MSDIQAEILEAAQTELSGAMVPWPDDYVELLSPPAALLVLRQMAMATVKVLLGATLSLDEDAEVDSGPLGEALNGVAACVAGATHSCVALAILPPEAEEALSI
jgi:hypothetical protein